MRARFHVVCRTHVRYFGNIFLEFGFSRMLNLDFKLKLLDSYSKEKSKELYKQLSNELLQDKSTSTITLRLHFIKSNDNDYYGYVYHENSKEQQ